MYFAPPIEYDKVMQLVPYGKLLTVGTIRDYFAKRSGADFTERLQQEYLFRLLRGRVISVLKMKHLIGVH